MKLKSAPDHLPKIPDKLHFPIREAARLTGVKPYVLRFWEKEFPMLSPRKERSGHRRYRRRDIELIFEIKQLLYEQGFTIAGARALLQKRSLPLFPDVMAESRSAKTGSSPSVQAVLRSVRRELRDLLVLLNQD